MDYRRLFRPFLLSALILAGLMISPAGSSMAADLTVGGGAVVAADLLNLRGGPDAANPRVASLQQGTSLKLLAGPMNEGWWRVTDGTLVGYVKGDWLAPAEPPNDPAAFDLDLPVPFHRQLTPVWCDPADLQSWTEYVQGQSIGQSYAVQQQMWSWELGHNAGYTEDEWNCSPFAVASAARQWMPDRGFNHFTYDDAAQATRVMAWLLASPQYREPSVALIWEGEHYILVRGVRATADPSVDPQAKILGLYVMDPNQGSRSWLGEDRYIPMADWLNRYLTPISYLTPHTGMPGDPWQGKAVTIQRDWENSGPTLEGRLNATSRSYGPPAQ